jgi:hypothetical protein
LLAEFSRIGESALASVVLTDGQRVLFGDYPAKFRGEGADLWRVDDGGELSAEGFDLVFVAQQGQQYALAVSWAGTEGRSLGVFVSDGGAALNPVIKDYWRQMPD